METLFNLHEFSQKRICVTCGEEFLPSQKAQRFCCSKCKRVFFQRKEASRIKARFEYIQNNQVPLPENLSEIDKEAVKLYTQRKYGIRAIARWQNRSYSQVRRALIDAGVYRPTPEQNRRTRKGTGPRSRILNEERKKEWKRKVEVCLEGLKRGVGVETTCHANGWTPAGVWFYLYRNSEYKEWKASHPAKPANVKQYERGRMFDWRSKKYSTERPFQDAIAELLRDSHIAFVREKKFLHSRSRVDFEVDGLTHIECKICTKSNIFVNAIGKAFLSKAEGKEAWLVIPDDVSVRKDQRELLQHSQIQVFSETGLREKLAGREIVQVQTKTTGVYSFCKCCAKEGVPMSRSPSGSVRSYCVNCEDEIKQRIFDQHLDRWISRPTVENIMPGL